jgi:hypothetical protein
VFWLKKLKKLDKPPINISFARVFTHVGQWKSQKWGRGAHIWFVAIFTPMYPHASMQLSKVLTFWKATFIINK